MTVGLRVVGLVLGGTIAVLLVMLAPDLYGFLPPAWRRHRLGLALAGFAAAYAILRLWTGRRSASRPATDPLRRIRDRLDGLADRAMGGGLSAAAIAIGAACLATWVPHYLLWPWYRDSDTFAILAQSWDAGILPYRDIRAYNFPGAIYLFWILGKLAGWGRTWALYAVDAAALILLGWALITWSRRCLGRVLPGAMAYLIFLTFYLSQGYFTVAQRDWHASLGVVLGLLGLQARPGRTSRLVSAALAAAALATRPHVLVFLPALAAAVAEGAEGSDLSPAGSRTRGGLVRALAEWLLAFGVFTALAFAPLLIAGIADDLVRGLRVVAYGGPYNRADPATVMHSLAEEIREPATLIVIGLLALMLASSRGAPRRRAATWAAALAAALLYRLVHPVQHAYLIYPVALVGAVATALPIAWLADRTRIAPALRVTALLMMVSELSPGLPLYCDLSATRDALIALARGQTLPTSSPPGSRAWFDPRYGRWYTWEDYRRVLLYLREATGPTTLVANVLKEPPFPAINGPTGRLSPFRAESGICWMWLVQIDLEPEFAAALEQANDSVVVWSPAEHELLSQLRLDRLAAVIRQHYRLEARFGRIEVWRRATESPSAGSSPSGPLTPTAD